MNVNIVCSFCRMVILFFFFFTAEKILLRYYIGVCALVEVWWLILCSTTVPAGGAQAVQGKGRGMLSGTSVPIAL